MIAGWISRVALVHNKVAGMTTNQGAQERRPAVRSAWPFHRIRKALILALALLAAGCPQVASAATRVIFYSHGWESGPKGETIFPHAFIRIQHFPEGGPPFDKSYGFHTRVLTRAMVGSQGYLRATGNHNYRYSKPDFWLEISDDQYRALIDRIAWWSTPEGSAYNVWSRNCFDFVADMAETIGLKPGNTRTFKPLVFMSETWRLNPGRLRPSSELDLQPPEPTQPPAELQADPVDDGAAGGRPTGTRPDGRR